MKARDLMIPASECARVAEDRTIYDAVIMLEAWRNRSQSEYRPRLVLVFDKQFRIIGSLRQIDMLRALATTRQTNTNVATASAGSNAVPSGRNSANDDLLPELSMAAHHVRVKDAMYLYQEAQYIEEDASLEETLDRLVAGPYLSLIVTSGNKTVGLVRLSDIFSKACKEIKRSGKK